MNWIDSERADQSGTSYRAIEVRKAYGTVYNHKSRSGLLSESYYGTDEKKKKRRTRSSELGS